MVLITKAKKVLGAFKRYRKYQSLKQIFQNKLHQDDTDSWLTHEIKKSDCGKIIFSPILVFIYFLSIYLSIYLSLLNCQVPVEH